MAGFFLLYSLIWKKFEFSKRARSSLFSPGILLFYLLTIIIIVVDYLLNLKLLFISQIIVFGLATIISYNNLRKSERSTIFIKLYPIVLFLNMILWAFNLIIAIWLDWDFASIVNLHILNGIIFLLFLYGVLKVTRK